MSKPIVWLRGAIRSPPFSVKARREAGLLSWRIVYCIEPSAILILDVFAKTTQVTPTWVVEACRRRLAVFRERFGS